MTRVSQIAGGDGGGGGGGGWGRSSSPSIIWFFKNQTLSKLMSLHKAPLLKNEAPQLKYNPTLTSTVLWLTHDLEKLTGLTPDVEKFLISFYATCY